MLFTVRKKKQVKLLPNILSKDPILLLPNQWWTEAETDTCLTELFTPI